MYIITGQFTSRQGYQKCYLYIGFPSNFFLRLKKMRNLAEFIFAIGKIWEHLRH